jgi:hypothetical protein
MFSALSTADAARCRERATLLSAKSGATPYRRSTTASDVRSVRSPSTSSIVRIARNIRDVASILDFGLLDRHQLRLVDVAAEQMAKYARLSGRNAEQPVGSIHGGDD